MKKIILTGGGTAGHVTPKYCLTANFKGSGAMKFIISDQRMASKEN